MKTDLNHSPQARAYAHLHAGSATSDAAPSARGTRYTYPIHPEILREAPRGYPQSDTTPIPIPEAIVRAARLLRSLSVVTNALRRNQL